MYEMVIIEFIFYIIAYGEKRFRASKDPLSFNIGYGLLQQAGYAEGL